MAKRAVKPRSRSIAERLAAALETRGWSPVTLLNRADRLLGARGGARLVGSGLRYASHDRHLLDIWAPPARLPKPDEGWPVVVFFYGGGWHSGHRADYGFAAAAFADAGFLAVVPDYRLAPAVRYPGFLWDAALALRWVVRNIAGHGGDPRRIALSGHSAGAYISAMLALDTRWLDGVHLPPDTIKGAALISGPYDFAPFREYRGRAAFAHWPDPVETQPITHVRADAPPILLLHGQSDRLVYAKNSRVLAARLEAVGAPVVLNIYPQANHVDPLVALSRPFRSRLPVLDDAVTFLRSATALPTSASE
jgi:acetyl esterase/lipase